MELSRYLGALRQRLWVIILCGIACAGAAAAFLVLKPDPPLASASVLFFLPDSESGSTSAQVNFMNQQIDTVVGLTDSDQVAQQVIDDLGLDMTLGDFKSAASASRVADTNTVVFSFADEDGQQGVVVVGKLIDEVLRRYQDKLGEPTQRILSQIDERIAALEPQIQDIDNQIADFLAANGIGSIDSARDALKGIIEHTGGLRDAIASGNQTGSSGAAQTLIDQRREELADLARAEVQFNELERKKKVLDARLDALIDEQKQARQAEADILKRVQVQTLGEPTVEGSDLKGAATRVAAAFVLGLVLGCVIAILLDLLDRSIRSPEDAERLTGAPVLAIIPNFESAEAIYSGGPNSAQGRHKVKARSA